MRRDYPQELQGRELAGKLKSKIYDVCHICKKQMKKRDMITLLAKTGRGIPPKQMVMVCPECFRRGCGQYGIKEANFDKGKAAKSET